jgi:hypothetical protein
VLQPFITDLLDATAAGTSPGAGADDEMIGLEVSGQELCIDPWTQQQLQSYSGPEGSSESECTRMVTQSVALLAKCEVDLVNLQAQDQQTPGSLYAAQAQLMLDAAVGQSLVMDIQRVIDDLLKSGRLEHARQLSKFHHQLRNAMFQLRGRIDSSHHSTLQDLADRLSDTESMHGDPADEAALEIEGCRDPAAEATDTPSSGACGDERTARSVDPPSATRRMAGTPAAQVAPGRRASRPQRRPVKRSTSGGSNNDPKARAVPSELPSATIPRLTVVLTGLFLLTAAWLTVVVGSTLGAAGPGTFEGIDRATFAATEGQIEDRWPSLFVTVKTQAWDGLSDRERTRFAQELSNKLSPDGYSGALIRSTDGVPLAEWLRGGGVRLLDSGRRTTGRRGRRGSPIDAD